MGRWVNVMEDLGGMVAASVILVVLGLIYFMVAVWIVSTGARVVVGREPSADFTVLSAALLALAGLVGPRGR